MVSEKFYLRLLTFVTLLTVLALSGNVFLPFPLFFPLFFLPRSFLHFAAHFVFHSKMSAKSFLQSSYVLSMNVG